MKSRIYATLLAVASFGVGAPSAWAVLILGTSDPANNRAEWTFGPGPTQISIANNSNYAAVITGFGFDYSGGSVLGLTSVTGTLNNSGWSFATNQSGSPFGTFDAAAITGPNLLGGNTNEGIAVGGTGIFTFSLAGIVNVTNYFVRFQNTGADGEGSDKGLACYSNCTPPSRVPEPSTLALLGLGLAGLGLIRRKRSA